MDPYNFLSQFKKYGNKGGFKPGLKRVEKLLSYFDNPQDKIEYIHIGGSNGKGSTAAMLTSILKEAGYKVGTYISPPLIHFNERFKINGVPISTKELTSITSRLETIFKKYSDEISIDEPSFFEIITVIAFIYFCESDIDIGIMEVGLGGRLDATNVIKSPLLSIITNISLEHADILGPEIKDIAKEKAGIIKKGVPLITSASNQEVINVFEKITKEKESLLVRSDNKNNYIIKDKSLDYQVFDIYFKSHILKNIKLNILGKHQIENAALVIKSIEYLPNKYNITEKSIYAGLANCKWPGRLEVINRSPDIILDGAHNVDGIKRLIDFLKENISLEKKVYFIISILKDKNYKEMIKIFKELNNDITMIITENNNERTLKSNDIMKVADYYKFDNKAVKDIYEAVKYVNKVISIDDTLCVTGSLYTVAEARFYLYLLGEGGLKYG